MQLIGTNITAERGDKILFSGLNFTLSRGELLTVTGPNGAGKSTLLRIISDLLHPLSGHVTLENEGHFLKPASWCHYLSAQNAMKSCLTVHDNLHFWGKFLENPLISIEKALARVGISHLSSLPYRVLSTGQRRRAATARLLITYRPIWLLDEPTSGLDHDASKLVATLMKEHLDKGGMIIAATHLPLGIDEKHHINIADFRYESKENTL